MIQYLVKWKEWEPEHNSWIFVKDCSNSMKLVMKFENRQTTEKREWSAMIPRSIEEEISRAGLHMISAISLWKICR
jgi:hypothetical protein